MRKEQVLNVHHRFQSAVAFSGAISAWDTSNVQRAVKMCVHAIMGAEAALQELKLSIAGFAKPQVSMMTYLRGTLRNWQTCETCEHGPHDSPHEGPRANHANNVRHRFSRASSFNYDITGWSLPTSTTATSMFAFLSTNPIICPGP